MRTAAFYIRRAQRLSRATAAAAKRWVEASRLSGFEIGKGGLASENSERSAAAAYRLGRFEGKLSIALMNAETALGGDQKAMVEERMAA